MTTEVQSPRSRDASIEGLRGLAAILMVAGHVIGNTAARGMQVAPDSAWRIAYVALEDVRMPLFTMISGYVYAFRPLRAVDAYPTLLKGKARRLLIPMLVVGYIFLGVQQVVPVNQRAPLSDGLLLPFYGFEHLWYLQAVFVIFMVVGLLDVSASLATPRRWLLVWSLASIVVVVLQVPPQLNVLSWVDGMRLLPFFLLGIALKRFSAHPLNRHLGLVAVGLFVVAYILHWALNLDQDFVGEAIERALRFSVGVTALVALYYYRKIFQRRFLVRLGYYSFGIFLLHVFAVAAARIALHDLGSEFQPLIFTVSLTVGLGGPIVVELLLGRFAFFSWAIFGRSPRKHKGPVYQTVQRQQ